MAKRQDYSRRPGEPKTRVCKKCVQRKPIENYSFYRRKGEDNRKGHCKKCVNAYHVARRERDPELKRRHKDYVRASVAKLHEEMNELKRVPCKDCKRSFNPWQMHFDHVRGEKVDNVSTLAKNGSTAKFWIEVEKCEVVCACCHADRTYQRLRERSSVS